MYTSGHLDWLEMTYPFGMSPNDTLPRELLQSKLKNVGKGAHGYETRLTNDQGVSIMLDGSSAQGVHVTLPGSVLWNLRALGATDRSLCQHAALNGGRVSRIDAAVNIFDGRMTVDDLHEACNAKRCVTRSRTGIRYQGIHTTNSGLYLGSQKSDKFIRAYDKRAESGIDGAPWLRLELQARNKPAKAIASSITSHENTRAVVNRAVKSFANWPTLDECVSALEDDNASIEPVPRKEPATLIWALNVVCPAVAHFMTENADIDLLAIINSEVNRLLRAQYEVDAG